jgi:hypothetical protein
MDGSRKAILLFNLTGYMAGGVILGDRDHMRRLF